MRTMQDGPPGGNVGGVTLITKPTGWRMRKQHQAEPHHLSPAGCKASCAGGGGGVTLSGLDRTGSLYGYPLFLSYYFLCCSRTSERDNKKKKNASSVRPATYIRCLLVKPGVCKSETSGDQLQGF
ncbi:hypothetical protein BaRGS_00013041 [Batillaria attramentaria]|uniref:Uncharacterized protein n=1 Tax=Batillaria attramentaria TaxID=370345 RepID=A0ABD0L908_9CAEN